MIMTAKQLGLDLSKVTPDALAVFADAMERKVYSNAGAPPEDWQPVMKLAEQSKPFGEWAHEWAHVIMACPSCGPAKTACLALVLMGFELAVQLLETQALEEAFPNESN